MYFISPFTPLFQYSNYIFPGTIQLGKRSIPLSSVYFPIAICAIIQLAHSSFTAAMAFALITIKHPERKLLHPAAGRSVFDLECIEHGPIRSERLGQ